MAPSRMAAAAKSSRQNRLGYIVSNAKFSDGAPLNLDRRSHMDHMISWWMAKAGVSRAVAKDDLVIVWARLRQRKKVEQIRERITNMYDDIPVEDQDIRDEAAGIIQEHDVPVEDQE